MKRKQLSILIPISGDISDLQNLEDTIKRTKSFEDDIDVLLLFDEKDTEKSDKNWAQISAWKYRNLEIHSQIFSSVGSARNFGISRANSSWICFTDADDVNLVDNFYSMVREAESENTEVAVGRFCNISIHSGQKSNNEINVLNPKEFQIHLGLNPGIWRCAFKLESLGKIKFPDLNMAEDQIFVARFFDIERRIHFSDEVVYQYFVGNENSLTSRVDQIARISRATPISIHLANETKGPYQPLLETLAISQLLSALKYGELRTKIISTFKLVAFIGQLRCVRVFRRLRTVQRILRR